MNNKIKIKLNCETEIEVEEKYVGIFINGVFVSETLLKLLSEYCKKNKHLVPDKLIDFFYGIKTGD